MKIVSEETKRKISEALKRHYAAAGRKLQETEKRIYDKAKKGTQKEDSDSANKRMKANITIDRANKSGSSYFDKVTQMPREAPVLTTQDKVKNKLNEALYHTRRNASKAVDSVKETARKVKARAKLARDTYNDVKGARDPEEALERARKRLKP